MLQTSGIDASELIGGLTPLLLYADDLVVMYMDMSTSKEGLQRQIDALADFCAGQQLEVRLSKTSFVVFEARRSLCLQAELWNTDVWVLCFMQPATWHIGQTF